MKVQSLFEEELEDYIKRLTKKELMKKLGSGSFAAVFQHPIYHNMAVKVFDGSDYGYRDWLKFVKRNQQNKFVPKLVSVHFVKNEHNDEIGLVFMKKLKKAPVSSIMKLASEWRGLAVRGGLELPPIRIGDYKFRKFTIPVWKAVAEQATDKDVKAIAQFFAKTDPIDIHDANIMADEDGQLVFTDPLSA